MTKIMFENEEGFLEIVNSDRIYVDPDAPTDILIVVRFDGIKIRVKFSDTEASESFMNILFECDKINLYEIANDNPGIEITVEEDEDMEALFGTMGEAFSEYLEDSEDYMGDEDEE